MAKILKFNDFLNTILNESWKDVDPTIKKNAAGVAIIFTNDFIDRILLVHPTGASWKKGTCGIPKGGMEPGENPMEAALRELKEETGIILSPKDLDPEPQVVQIYDKKGKKVNRQLIYFVLRITELSQIGLDTIFVPKSQLQKDEIDWAKFVSADEAYPITSRTQLIILDRLLSK